MTTPNPPRIELHLSADVSQFTDSLSAAMAETESTLHLQIAPGYQPLCGAKANQTWRTTIYAWTDCAECRAIADRMMAEDERAESKDVEE